MVTVTVTVIFIKTNMKRSWRQGGTHPLTSGLKVVRFITLESKATLFPAYVDLRMAHGVLCMSGASNFDTGP